jgi:alpha-beta hydrolase superfamily lysophospholipase
VLVLLLAMALTGGAGWYFSNVLLRPLRVIKYPETALSVREGEVRLVPSRWTMQPGTWGLRWSGGVAVVGSPVADPAPESPVSDANGSPVDTGMAPVRRPLLALTGPIPPPGTPVAMDAGPYDLPSDLGLAAKTVWVPTPLGDCPAWLVPATGSTWVVAVHGRGADRRECLRVLPVLHRLGHPVLAISYRNDGDAPASPDGYYHLGDTEWLDLAAAVAYARRHGADELVLYGWSMGAAITAAYLDRAPAVSAEWSADVAAVRAVVWDSPLLDWYATLRQQASLRRLPPGLTSLATLVTRWRIGIDFERFNLVRRPPLVRPPTLVFHGDSDTMVPVGPSRALAAAAERLRWRLRYMEVAGAEHTAPWNVDPAGYESAVADFLTEHACARKHSR